MRSGNFGHRWFGRLAQYAGALGAVALGGLGLAGCASTPRETLVAPRAIIAPYDISAGEALWVVLPLRNESGTGVFDPLEATDHLTAAVEEVRGLRAVPLARTLAALRTLDMRTVRTPAEARLLAQTLGADGVLVGSINAYDPYTPEVGVALALFARSAGEDSAATLDVRTLRAATSDTPATQRVWADRPSSTFSGRFDGKDHGVLMELRSYAEGRTRSPSALGWRRYTASADLFTQFVMHQAMAGLMREEWTRVAREQMPDRNARPSAAAPRAEQAAAAP